MRPKVSERLIFKGYRPHSYEEKFEVDSSVKTFIYLQIKVKTMATSNFIKKCMDDKTTSGINWGYPKVLVQPVKSMNYRYIQITYSTFLIQWNFWLPKKPVKVHKFWERHKFLLNLHRRFVLCSNGQIHGGDFAKFCGFLRIYEL